jgi:transcription elongation factor GreA
MFVTSYSTKSKKAQLDALTSRREKIMADMQDAKSQGDLSENFGYEQCRRDLSMVDNQIESVRREFGSVRSEVDPMDWVEEDTPEFGALGTVVTFQRADHNAPESILIGGAWDNHHEGIAPHTTPLAKALILKEPGETSTMVLENHEVEITVHSVRRPTKEEISAFYPVEPEKKKEKPKKEVEGPVL